MDKTAKLFLLFLFCSVFLFSSNSIKAEDKTDAAPSKIRVIYFYADDCQKCVKLKPFIEKIKAEYKDKIDFFEHSVKEKEECRRLFFKFIETYNIPGDEAKIPIIFVGKDYLLGTTDIENDLEAKIDEKVLAREELLFDCRKFLEDWKNGSYPSDNPDLGSCSAIDSQDFCGIAPNDNKKIDSKKQAISIGLIIGTAAIDSINPCAIAVLLFLLAILISLKSKKQKILAIGLTYVFGVFISYYLAGIGMLKIISHYNIESKINIFAGIIVIIASFISIKEGLMPQTRQLLVIPESTKSILARFLKKAAFPAVFIAGILVSAFELPCTGQVYLGILSLMSQENMKAQAYFYLLLYNLIFVSPLIIILFASAWGLDIERLQNLRKSTRKSIKILIGVIMLILGIWLIYSTLY